MFSFGDPAVGRMFIKLETVQRRFLRMLPRPEDLNYRERFGSIDFISWSAGGWVILKSCIRS